MEVERRVWREGRDEMSKGCVYSCEYVPKLTSNLSPISTQST